LISPNLFLQHTFLGLSSEKQAPVEWLPLFWLVIHDVACVLSVKSSTLRERGSGPIPIKKFHYCYFK